MRLKQWLTIGVSLMFVFGSVGGVIAEKRKPVVQAGKTFLPLRVLARPFSNIYKAADDQSAIVKENVPVFQSYYVYTRPDVKLTATKAEGWYEVGSDNRGTVLGWMKADDVMEWKQTMCLAYEHPGGRKPVLMFEDLDALRSLVKAPPEERKQKTEEYYQAIRSQKIGEDFPIVSIEPDGAIDITEQFYLLPILEHSEIEIEGREGRLLKLAAATKAERGGGTLKEPDVPSEDAKAASGADAEAAESAETQASTDAGSGGLEGADLKNLQMDIVYVVDMTGSMMPYITATKAAIADMSRSITQDPATAQSVRFGLWGYRDSTTIPGLEFNTRNFTPQLQDKDAFEQTLAGVRAATVGSQDYAEDVFTGVDKAMRETQWTPNALHILVLLGDAPSHEAGHQWNESGQSAMTLRTFADDKKLSLFAVHIRDGRASEYWELTETQFRTLSQNRGLETSSYWSVPAKDMSQFQTVSQEIAQGLVGMVKSAKQGTLSAKTVQQSVSSPGASKEDIKAKVKKMGYAALVDWLGRESGEKAPRDIIAWVTDKDLLDPAIQALDVRVLINKKQIDSLRKVLQEIMTAGRRGIIGGEKFFDALQAVPSVASRAGDQIKNAKSLAETDLVPEFMADLPYKSQIMSMSNELWSSWSLDQQEQFLNQVDAKIKLYVAIHDEPQGWIALHQGDDPDDYVYPLSLTALP